VYRLFFFCARCVVPKIGPKILSKKAPNTHLWLILIHSVLPLHFSACHNELLKIFLYGCDLLLFLCFLLQNPFCFLCGNGVLKFFCVVLHFFLSYALCSNKLFYHPKCFLLQWIKLLCKSILFKSYIFDLEVQLPILNYCSHSFYWC
jgi:hypothetical protein